MRLMIPALALMLTGFGLTACGSKDGGDGEKAKKTEMKVPAAAKGAARAIFAERCVTCHGTEGKGDGPAGKMLDPKPRSFADAEWQKKTTDEHLRKVIVGGGAAVGMSPLMTPNPDLANQPDVVNGLILIVRKQGG